ASDNSVALSGSADEQKFPPPPFHSDGLECGRQNRYDALRLRKPLLIGAPLVFDHCHQCVHALRQPARHRTGSDTVDQFKKWRLPWFNHNEQTSWPENPPHLANSQFKIVRERCQMM